MSEPASAANRRGEITRFFGDGDHTFRIGIGEAEELDEIFKMGLVELTDQVAAVRVPVLKHVLRVARVGGGAKKEEAYRWVNRHLVAGYLMDAANIAFDAIKAALQGAPDDMPGEPKGEGTQAASTPSQTGASATA